MVRNVRQEHLHERISFWRQRRIQLLSPLSHLYRLYERPVQGSYLFVFFYVQITTKHTPDIYQDPLRCRISYWAPICFVSNNFHSHEKHASLRNIEGTSTVIDYRPTFLCKLFLGLLHHICFHTLLVKLFFGHQLVSSIFFCRSCRIFEMRFRPPEHIALIPSKLSYTTFSITSEDGDLFLSIPGLF